MEDGRAAAAAGRFGNLDVSKRELATEMNCNWMRQINVKWNNEQFRILKNYIFYLATVYCLLIRNIVLFS